MDQYLFDTHLRFTQGGRQHFREIVMRLGLVPAIVGIGLLAGCATPVSHVNAPMNTYDQNTKYSVTDHPKGYTITVFYSRYQFIPESDAVATACTSALTSIGWEVADNRGVQIKPINEQRIKISMGRNIVSAITSCQASALVELKN